MAKQHRRSPTRLIKYILLGNFWSFLLTLGGIVDIALGLLFLTGVIPVKGSSPLIIFIICLITGLIYLAAGLAIAIRNLKKQSEE